MFTCQSGELPWIAPASIDPAVNPDPVAYKLLLSEAADYPTALEIDKVVSLGDIQFLISAFEATAYADLLDLPHIGWHPVDCP